MYRLLVVAVTIVVPMFASAGKVSPLFKMETPDVRTFTAGWEASVVLSRDLDDELIAKLEAAGAQVVRLPSGRPAAVGRVVSVLVSPDGLDALALVPEVVRIDPVAKPFTRTPLNETAPMIGATTAWNAPASHPGYTGEGVVVADIEMSWDIFHPDLFRPDGGGYDFFDADGNGQASPGDLVDLDGDGIYESELRLYSIPQLDYYTGEGEPPSLAFRPEVDWLYVDTNGNGVRDYGAAAGFTDQDPAFGEPIFIGDDLNGNHVIDPGERLLRLKTSKIRSVHTATGKALRRGTDLSTFQHLDAVDMTDHGLGATAIVAAGWPGVNRRFVGMAPGVDLVLIQYGSRAFATALEEKVDVVFVELASPMEFHDGSSPDEEALAALTREGVTVVTATGNLAGVQRTARVFPRENETTRVPFQMQQPGGRLRLVFFLITWKGPEDGVETFLVDGDTRLRLVEGARSFAGMNLSTSFDHSARGTSMLLLRISAPIGGTLPLKEFGLDLHAQPGIEEIRLMALDDAAWGPGAWFVDHEDDEVTALVPSTADGVISVGAYVGRRMTGLGGEKGAVTSYSGKGLRIDGERVVDLVAPDDPFTASWGPVDGYAFITFGGTSGALPHVAGAASLLKEAFPHFGHGEIKEALLASARTDAHTGESPNPVAGFGKVDVARALFGEVEPGSEPIELRLEGVGSDEPGQETIVRATVLSAGAEITDAVVEFDVGWDGLYEISRTSIREVPVVADRAPIPVVARAFDATGRSARAVLWVGGEADCAVVGCEEGCCGDDGVCGECDDDGGSKKKKKRSGGGCSATGGDPMTWLLLPALLAPLTRHRRS